MEVVKKLSDTLTEKYGKGFSKRTVYKFLQFYKTFPEIVPTMSAQSEENEIVPTLLAHLLPWSHYERLLQVDDKDAREWYAKEAYEQTWSIRTLSRNISTQYYYRLLKSQDKTGVENEMVKLTRPLQDKLEFIKNPVIAEFLGMQENTSYYESDLEKCIIDNLQKFLMEIGKGYAFVMSDHLTSKAGTITSGEDRYMEWKTKDGNYENTQYAQFDTFFEGMICKLIYGMRSSVIVAHYLHPTRTYVCFFKTSVI